MEAPKADPREGILASSAALIAATVVLATLWARSAVVPLPRYHLVIQGEEGSKSPCLQRWQAPLPPPLPPPLPIVHVATPGRVRVAPPSRPARPLVRCLSSDSVLSVLLRPATRVTGRVSVRTFLLRDGIAQQVQVVPERSESGAFFLRGPVGQLLASVGAGAGDLIFVVARDNRWPAHLLALLTNEDGPSAGDTWQTFRLPIEITDTL